MTEAERGIHELRANNLRSEMCRLLSATGAHMHEVPAIAKAALDTDEALLSALTPPPVRAEGGQSAKEVGHAFMRGISGLPADALPEPADASDLATRTRDFQTGYSKALTREEAMTVEPAASLAEPSDFDALLEHHRATEQALAAAKAERASLVAELVAEVEKFHVPVRIGHIDERIDRAENALVDAVLARLAEKEPQT